jgi:hypothetical protein
MRNSRIRRLRLSPGLSASASPQARQIGEIRRGLAEARAGDFAKSAEVKAAFAAFRRPRRPPVR